MILEDLGEALVVMRSEENDVSEEMASLFFVKRRMVEVVKKCHETYQEMVRLRFQKTEEERVEKEEEIDLKEIFRKMCSEM